MKVRIWILNNFEFIIAEKFIVKKMCRVTNESIDKNSIL